MRRTHNYTIVIANIQTGQHLSCFLGVTNVLERLRSILACHVQLGVSNACSMSMKLSVRTCFSKDNFVSSRVLHGAIRSVLKSHVKNVNVASPHTSSKNLVAL